VEQREVSVDASRQQRRVLVVGLHHQATALKVAKIPRQRERHARATPAKRCVRDDVLAELRDIRDPWVFDPPELLWIVIGIR